MSKHTPGPWTVQVIDEDEGEPFIYGVCHPAAVCGVTIVCNLTSRDDAYAIAAVPDMLEALKNCVWLLADLQPEPGLVAQQAIAAIAKAEAA